MNIWYAMASAFVGYCLAAFFSANVSMTLGLTLWGSAWTYAVLLFWWLIGYFVTWLLVIGLIALVALIFGGTAVGALAGLGWLAEKHNRRTLRKKREAHFRKLN